MPLGMLRRPEPENVEEAGARLASLDDDDCVHQRREIPPAIWAPDLANPHIDEETPPGTPGAAHAEDGFMTAFPLRGSFPL